MRTLVNFLLNLNMIEIYKLFSIKKAIYLKFGIRTKTELSSAFYIKKFVHTKQFSFLIRRITPFILLFSKFLRLKKKHITQLLMFIVTYCLILT